MSRPADVSVWNRLRCRPRVLTRSEGRNCSDSLLTAPTSSLRATCLPRYFSRVHTEAETTVIAGGDTGDVSRMSLGDITTDSMRTAFAKYAKTHEAATIQRCWSTWNHCVPSFTPRN